ncbi:MAG: NAD(P)-dependent glycerol-3-phosphate dehydrogenase [Clostridia bacterium]|jgi:Glycerol-3-phosphate dehydrogenase|nr:NAD(P)-dependent glycerol-3-phosphate dehydrogenase [Clostridia bacterium]
MNITILGSGTWGLALARVLCLNGHHITVWSKFDEEAASLSRTRKSPNLPEMLIPEAILISSDMSAVMKNADYIIAAVPSVYIRETIRSFVPLIPGDAIWINASKGIEKGTNMILTDVIREELENGGFPNARITAVSGPTHAEEVAMDLPTLIVAAGPDDIAKQVQGLFEGTCIRPYTNPDLRGVQICGALKNVEALAVGIAKGLGYGDNTRAAMITRGMEEIRRLGLAMGCQERTFFGLAGIGDLIVTATSDHSRNNRCGILLGQGIPVQEAVRRIGMVVEGLNALPAAVSLCRQYHMEMPLIEGVRRIVEDQADPAEIVRDLMSRSLKNEI